MAENLHDAKRLNGIDESALSQNPDYLGAKEIAVTMHGKLKKRTGVNRSNSEQRKVAQPSPRSQFATHDLFVSVVESSDDAIMASTLDGAIARWNHGAEVLFGYAADEVVGKPLSMLVPDENLGHFHKVQEQLRRGDRLSTFEAPAVRKDGSRFESSLTVSSLRDSAGRVVAVGAIIRDVSERKRAEEAFRQSEAGFRFLFGSNPLPMWVFSTETLRFLEVNDAAIALYGYSREEFLGMRIPDHLLPEDESMLREVLAQRKGAFTAAGQWRNRTKNGKVVVVEIFAHTLQWEGQAAEHVVAIDITERRRAEEALRLSEERSARHAQQATRLTELVDLLQSCQKSEEAYRVMQSALPKTLSCPSGAICITNSSRNAVEAVVSWGDLSSERVFRPDDCWALRCGKRHQLEDPASPLRCAHITGGLSDSCFCIPLVAHGETLGVLYLESPSVSRSLTTPTDELDAIGSQAAAAAERISMALANIRLREALRSQSIRDPLTGLFNRRYLEETLERELSRASRNQQPVSVLMFDIDHFKQFNDTFGHQAGDKLLRAFGDFLSQRTRGQDIACRYGGEEFVIVLAGGTREAARQRAESLREELKQLLLEHNGSILGKVTVSIGVSVYPENGRNAEELLHASDTALYRAKAGGRDQIVMA